jgi:ergothioneine biosynthesis protein EgtB
VSATIESSHVLTEQSGGELLERYRRVRALSQILIEPLEPEDCVVQSIPEVSPSKWHLAHVTWFFENFILCPRLGGYEVFDERYAYLFNSYYLTVGDMHSRPLRGLLSRPTLREVFAYRRHVDDAIVKLLGQKADDEDLAYLVTLGINHEQQHQELLLTDIKHVFFANPLGPAYRDLPTVEISTPSEMTYLSINGGQREVGTSGSAFCFDNETPRHAVLVNDHWLANRLVTNAEFREFVNAGAYQRPECWLSDGWSTVARERWGRPLYWSEDLSQEFTLGGWRPIDAHAPVSHVSYYEADAYARWCGARLPSEQEWELSVVGQTVAGNLLESQLLHPSALDNSAVPVGEATQVWGDVWEWTASPYMPYPEFKPLAGSLGEYNGKFMANQMVVRGGSCVTSADHLRSTYRSFFYPQDRWQFLGIRLAKDK